MIWWGGTLEMGASDWSSYRENVGDIVVQLALMKPIDMQILRNENGERGKNTRATVSRISTMSPRPSAIRELAQTGKKAPSAGAKY